MSSGYTKPSEFISSKEISVQSKGNKRAIESAAAVNRYKVDKESANNSSSKNRAG
jgi:hypothetical protein